MAAEPFLPFAAAIADGRIRIVDLTKLDLLPPTGAAPITLPLKIEKDRAALCACWRLWPSMS